ncbi:hypothetical protein C3432_09070 [Citrobacter amalonaticus]|uniref:AlgX/AlgJ SGNH hydrolase-like domain-containing protein n=1 Tax=Citrobacter amalonaticus TaxID=35703 RepID=A0A2S4RZH7_CITAM|nr:hypothetical protein [Citrobacter amalonaticus]POT58063.1 hypothetical protein C3432_09070 [Citrobacter amalonaticus]POT76412.1 hypothetical protein C3436_02755 [Citrobacter amalonaticus]POU66589.1 hypothetical protein C3430_07270 [Citrobacter amalonaticus]POV05647.1 hypothetical protein C3424_10060 [Citrobacter amalonaticus]
MKGKVFLFSAIVIASLAILPTYNIVNEPHLFKSKRMPERFRNLYNMDAVEAWVGAVAFKYGLSTEPEKVLIGKEGWLFLGDSFVKTLTKKIQGSSIIAKDMLAVSKATEAWGDYFKINGVQDFKIIIGPDKDSVYMDKLPKWDRHSPDSILGSLLHSDNEIYIDTLTPIMVEKGRTDKPLYYHTDTHWNSYGAGMAFNALASTMQFKHPDTKWPGPFTSAHFKTAEGRSGDLAAFLRVKNVKEELVYLDDRAINKTNIKVFDFKTGRLLSEKRLTVIGAPPTPALVVSDNALNDDRVLWLRDSYGTAMSPFMSRTFREVLQVHPGKVTPELLQIMVKSFKPKYVFITSVERDALGKFFTSPPDTNE